MASEVVTLHIDDTSLRLLVARGKKVVKWADLPLEAGLVKDGVIVNQAEVVTKIRELLETEKVGAKKVVAGLSGLHCLSRLINLPQLPKGLMDEAVSREAERVIPVPLEQLYISWQTITNLGNEQLVFLAAFPRNAADALIETLRSAGLDPYLMDLKPLALARTVDKPTAIVADVRSADVDIVVMVDRVPQLIRTLSLPSDTQSWEEKVPVIKEELDRTTKFYDSSHTENPLDPSEVTIFVSGDLDVDSEAYQSLANDSRYSVLPLPSPLEWPQDCPVARYMANVGLALKVLSSPQLKGSSSVVNFNALPDIYQPRKRSTVEMLTVPSLIVAAAVVAFLVMLILSSSGQVGALQTELDSTNTLLVQKELQRQAQTREIAELEVAISETDTVRDALSAARKEITEDSKVNSDLRAVWDELPASIDLTGIRFSHGTIVVGGISPSEVEALTYARDLRTSDLFSQVIISRMTQELDEDEEEVMVFEFTLFE